MLLAGGVCCRPLQGAGWSHGCAPELGPFLLVLGNVWPMHQRTGGGQQSCPPSVLKEGSQEEQWPCFNYSVAPREARALLWVVLSPFTASAVCKSKLLSVRGLRAPGRKRIYEWVIRKCNIKDQDQT